MGLAQIGPIHRGSLGAGREVRLPIELTVQCATVVALGGDGVADLDATLLDPSGQTVSRDMTRDPQAVLRACVERAGTYELRLRMASGAGDFLAATWAGSVGGASSPAEDAASASALGAGTCESPLPLAEGTFNGSTSRGLSEHEGDCANTTSREVVYRFELTERQRVVIDVDPRFDSVIYLRRGECDDADAQVACNDDAAHGRSSRLDEALDPGVYYLFVDGYSGEVGTFRMTVSMSDVPSLEDACRAVSPLSVGAPVSGSMRRVFDRVHSNGCGESAKGPDVLYRLDVPQPARVRIVERSDDFHPVVHLRRRCVDEATEVGCSDEGFADGEAAFVGVLPAGSYTVAADARARDADGSYTIAAEWAPEGGQPGTAGDGCGDAVPLSPHDREVSGDTFSARDDMASKCGGRGSPDVVYRLEVPRRSRLTASFTQEEGAHAFALRKACADATTELSCGTRLDTVLEGGVYALVVDGASDRGLGRFTFAWRLKDVVAQDAACRAAALLPAGVPVQGTTRGAGDKFGSSCGGPDDVQASPDRVYKLVMASKGRARIAVEAASWDPVLVLRRACVDAPIVRGTPGPEIACNNDAEDTRHSRIETVLEAGTYYVVVDGHGAGNEGTYTLNWRVLP